MKYTFNFIQILNWIHILNKKIDSLDCNKENKQELINEIKKQQSDLLKLIDIINRKTKLIGVQREFLEKYKEMKRK